MTPLPPEKQEWSAQVMLVAVVGLLFLQAPVGGAFYWSDAPRHALNGVFVKDFVAAMPFSDPVGFAERYYLQYPALTILFYPPLFYFISAPAFAIFGVSQETALGVVLVHYIAFALGLFRLFRFWLEPVFAFAAALIIVGAPEIAFWGRQVMLEVPAFAFAVWSAVFFVGHLRKADIWRLYLAAALLVLAMYTKLSVVFLAPVFAIALVSQRGWPLLRDRHTYIIAALALVSLAPLAVLTAKFGQANVQSLVGIADAEAARWTLAGWLWYLGEIPDQLGLAAVAAAAIGLVATIALRARFAMRKPELLLWALWFAAGYLFLSSIDLKEARHSVLILPPLAFAAILPVAVLLRGVAATAVALLIGAATLAQTMMLRPVLYVDGFANAARTVGELAPKDAIIMFSGYRDGAFILNMRAREDRRDITIVRADKLLLQLAVRRGLGVTERPLSEEEIRALLTRLKISYVVAQPGFWNDLAVMRRLEAVLGSSSFREVVRIKAGANFEAAEDELVIYRNLARLPEGPVKLDIELKIIERSLSGELGPKQHR